MVKYGAVINPPHPQALGWLLCGAVKQSEVVWLYKVRSIIRVQ